MSKPFNYSKWDNIELSDDEDDVHPNIDKESWFRMRHRSRLEREDNESKDKAKIQADIDTANQRIRIIQHEISKLNVQKVQASVDGSDDDDDEDDDLDFAEREGLEAELKQLQQANLDRQNKMEEYEQNKKWNIDNMFEVKDERTVVNPNAGKESFTESGYAVEKLSLSSDVVNSNSSAIATSVSSTAKTNDVTKSSTKAATKTSKETSTATPVATVAKPIPPIGPAKSTDTTDLGAMGTYVEFTERYADTVEEFMACKSLEASKECLLKYGNILLCENASNYLLLASLEDEMNGLRDKMKITARQSQVVSSIAELAKTVHQHPGNVIQPFFARLQERKHLEDFLKGVNVFVDKIIQRAVVKKAEIDEQRAAAAAATTESEGTDLGSIPLEERLGPGGLDPLEVIETLPSVIVEAFESRDVEQLKAALASIDPDEAEYHMKRCIDSGLWVANA
jgi:cell division cycle protein 37